MEERRLRLFQSLVPGEMFGFRKEEVTCGWRSCMVSSLVMRPAARVSKSRRMRWAGNVARMGERGNIQDCGRDLPGRPRHVLDDNTRMDLN